MMNNQVRYIPMVALIVAILALNVFAETSTKTFEIGPGTAYATSNFRNFYVPGCEPIGVTVKYKRSGETGSSNDIPIVIEVRHPGANADTGEPIVAPKNDPATRS